MFLLVGFAMTPTAESRVLLGDIDASIELLSVDAWGNRYFKFKNEGEGSLYFSGYGNSSPVYSIKIRDESGIWQRAPSDFFCGTGLGTAVINPGETVFFDRNEYGESVRVGVAVSTDPMFQYNSKVIWSDENGRR